MLLFTRSRHSLTRQSITQAKNRSINTILKHQTRSKQYCMFYNKFGKCTKKEAGNCPFIHDRDKIAVCRRFLQGSCHKDNCLLSHKAAPEKMPVCKFYLEGVCSKEPCPYLHVKVSEAAAICPAFLAGFCKNGSDCKLRHVMACPEWDRLGTCSRPAGKCPFPHVTKGDKEKKVAPVKPKRTTRRAEWPRRATSTRSPPPPPAPPGPARTWPRRGRSSASPRWRPSGGGCCARSSWPSRAGPGSACRPWRGTPRMRRTAWRTASPASPAARTRRSR